MLLSGGCISTVKEEKNEIIIIIFKNNKICTRVFEVLGTIG